MVYQRRQYASVVVMSFLCYGWLVVVVAVLLGMGVETKDLVDVVPSLLIPVVFMSVAFLAFRSLMVLVTASQVELACSFGWPRKRIERSEIVSAVPLRIPWWYGVGIRATPKGWMWNVSGINTVLLTLANGKGLLTARTTPTG